MADTSAGTEDVLQQPLRSQLEVFLDEHRRELGKCLSGMTEEQARRTLVPSRTRRVGLVKHATFVERVWFGEAVTGRTRSELGLVSTPDESFVLDDGDTIAGAGGAPAAAGEASRQAVSPLSLDDVVHGTRRGPLPLRWVY